MKKIVIDKCIYCLSNKELSDEHILPYSMNGDYVLVKGSCQRCSGRINKCFEVEINKHFYKIPRSFLSLNSRSKDFIESYNVQKDNQTIKVKTKDFGTIIDFPVIDTDSKEICTSVISYYLTNQNSSPSGGNYQFETKVGYYSFMRYLVKIAYGFLIFLKGIGMYNSKVTDFILGDSKDFPKIITINCPKQISLEGIKIIQDWKMNLHKIEYKILNDNRHFFIISFFNFLNGPKYVVEINLNKKDLIA